MQTLKKLAGQTLIYGLGTMLPRLLNYLILIPYFTYKVFKDDIGEFGKQTELYAYVSFLLILLTYGMETAFFRFYNKENHRENLYSTILTSIFVTSSFFVLIIFSFLDKISSFLEYSTEKDFVLIVALIVAIEAFTAIPFAKLRVEEKASKFALFKGINVFVNILIIFFFYNILPALGYGSFILNSAGHVSVKYVLLSNLITSLFILFLLIPELREYSLKKFNWALLKDLLRFGWPLLIAGFAGTINETFDRGILKQLLPEDQGLHDVALYGANYKIAAFVLLFIQMYRFALEPFFFNYANKRDSKKQYAELMNLFVGITVTMGLSILVFLDYIKYFIDPAYHEGLFVVPYIIVAYIFSGIYYNHSIWFKLTDKTIFAVYIASLGAAITILINVLYVPKYSYFASAIATVFAYGIMVLVSFLFSLKYYYIKYNLRRIFTYFILGGLFVLINSCIDSDNFIFRLLIKVTLVSIFIIFVGWKENLVKKLILKNNEGQNS